MDKKSSLTQNQRHTLALFDLKPEIKVADVQVGLNLIRPTAKQVLQRLVELELLEQRGQYRGTYYVRRSKDKISDQFGNDLVTVYKGQTGFRSLFQRFQSSMMKGDFYWSFAFKEEYYDPTAAEFLLNFHHELTRKKVEDKTIVHTAVLDQVKEVYRNVPDLMIRATNQDIPTGLSITKNEVVHLIWQGQPLAISVNAPQVVKRYQEFFKSMWKESTTQKP